MKFCRDNLLKMEQNETVHCMIGSHHCSLRYTTRMSFYLDFASLIPDRDDTPHSLAPAPDLLRRRRPRRLLPSAMRQPGLLCPRPKLPPTCGPNGRVVPGQQDVRGYAHEVRRGSGVGSIQLHDAGDNEYAKILSSILYTAPIQYVPKILFTQATIDCPANNNSKNILDNKSTVLQKER